MASSQDGMWLTPGAGPSNKRSRSPVEDGTDNKRTRFGRCEASPLLVGGSWSDAKDAERNANPLSPYMERQINRRLPGSPARSNSWRRFTQSSTPIRASPATVDPIVEKGIRLMRKYSEPVLGLREESSTSRFAEASAKYYIRNLHEIEFSAAVGEDGQKACPLSWSVQNTLFFNRGNHVYMKNMSISSSQATKICETRDSKGNLRLIESAGADQPNVVAIGTSRGYLELWDVSSHKKTFKVSVKSATVMRWNGPILTVGSDNGTIRLIDTRIRESLDRTRKLTRHMARISSLSWNAEGNVLASGDDRGGIVCWDQRQHMPLEFKAREQVGTINALAWCPWQRRLLATGSSSQEGKGTIRLWDVSTGPNDGTHSLLQPKTFDARLTSLHWSPHCKELLSTHGMGRENVPNAPLNPHQTSWEPRSLVNAIAVHEYPSFRKVTSRAASETRVAGSVLSPCGTKIAVAVPDEDKIAIWDAWGKHKPQELHRRESVLDLTRYIR